MSRILNNNNSIFTFEELHFFEQILNPKDDIKNFTYDQAIKIVSQLLNIQRNGYLNQKNPLDFQEESQKIIEGLSRDITPIQVFSAFLQYETNQNSKNRPCEQTPRNILYISEILEFYPNARIINMIRDPRDILLSQKNRWKRPFLSTNIPKIQSLRYWMNYHPITMSKLWNVNACAADQWHDDQRIYSLKFENLVGKPEESINQICEFLGISFNSELLEVPQVGSSNESDEPNCKGIDQGKIEGWRKGGLTPTEIFICQKINKNLMTKYGYLLEELSPNSVFLMISFIFFPVKLALSLLLNLNRIKNLKESIKRRLG